MAPRKGQQVSPATQFQKGISPNPGGRPKTLRDFQKLCRQQSPAAFRIIKHIMNDETAPHAVRLTAANSILDRAWGKPMQAVQVSGEDGKPIEINHSADAFLKQLADLRARLDATEFDASDEGAEIIANGHDKPRISQ
jgi:Family of unknown function (DUF5681)